MQAYSEILPPTAVTHAVRASLTGRKAHNLVIARTSLLQIFDLKVIEPHHAHRNDDVLEPSSPVVANGDAIEDSAGHNQTKLVLLAEYQLSGTITSIAPVKILGTKAGGQALLISCKDAKISLVEWNPETHGISTISIHLYEGDDMQSSPWAPALGQCPSFLTVDPSSRCAAFKFGQRHIAILPFRQAGDDLAMETYDPDIDGQAPQASAQINGNETQDHKPTPYAPSFVLPLTALDPSLTHPIDLAFLHEYREPTLGILSSARSPSNVLHPERKDCMSYTVFTLDIEQRARTPLLSVSGLPCDLFKLVPLPLPVGGSLLLGTNEVIHVDQGGKTTGIAVNEFAKKCSAFSMTDHGDLALKLENCIVEQINRTTGDMLFILDTGDLCTLSFRLDGRSVSGISLQRVSAARGGQLLGASASCAVAVGHDALFVGSEDTDSVILQCRRPRGMLSRKRSHAEMLGAPGDASEEEISDEDDLYGNDTGTVRDLTQTMSNTGSIDEMYFRIQDRLMNLSPTGEPTFGRRNSMEHQELGSSRGVIDLVIPVGHGRDGALACLSRTIQLEVTHRFEVERFTTDIWAIGAKAVEDQPRASKGDVSAGTKQYIITTSTRDGMEASLVYAISEERLELLSGTNFEMDTATLNAGVLRDGQIVVQVCPGEIRCYDQDLHLLQIVPMLDESDDELKILHSSFADPYLLVLRDDGSATVLLVSDSGDIEENEDFTEVSKTAKWTCGCLYRSSTGDATTYASLLSSEGNLQVFEVAKQGSKLVYSIENLRALPYLLSSEPSHRRLARQKISELLICDVGDDVSRTTYMIIRGADDDITLYKAYNAQNDRSGQAFTKNLRWIKASLDRVLQSSDDDDAIRKNIMRPIRLGHYYAVLFVLPSPTVLLQNSANKARLMPVATSAICAINGVSLDDDDHSLISVDGQGRVCASRLPPNTEFCQTGWAIQRHPLQEEIDGVGFHPASGCYVVGTNVDSSFDLPEDDWHHEWANEDTSLGPTAQVGKLKLFDPISHTVVHELELQQDERIICMKAIDLEISEKTHERKTLIAVGTAMIRGEDLPAAGSIYIIDVIRVVPDPDRPETNKALKIVARDESKGAVTAISDIGHEGFLIAAQGQKCVVRGLKEDDSLLPVAFMDMQCYVSSLKCVKWTGLVLMADALKGVWFSGFTSDPYALRLFGKSNPDLEVVQAEVLPQNKQLFLLAADSNCNMHVLEFNPENPKSLSGQRLLTRSTFYTGDFVRSMTLLPPLNRLGEEQQSNGDGTMNGDHEPEMQDTTSSVLITTQSGALALVTTLSEQTYRRLDALQTHLINILDHPCGLNPRAYRKVESEGFGARGVIDGEVLKRWSGLGAQRKLEACTRVGAEVWEIKGDINLISGGQLSYL